jgi:hypothetical protein
MDALAKLLDQKLRRWRPETSSQVRERIVEIIDLADHDHLDVVRSRAVEQDGLDLIDAPTSG